MTQKRSLLVAMGTAGLLSLTIALSADVPHAFDAGWKGKSVCEKLYEDQKIRVGRCTFPPGVGHERHYHPAHYLYSLGGGRMRVTDAKGTRDADVVPGVLRAVQPIEWHEALNVGDTTTQYLVIELKE